MTLQRCCNLNPFCIICSQRGNDSQPIWLDDLYCGHTDKSCVGYCQTCPSHEATDCKHKEDLTVQCSKNNNYDNKCNFHVIAAYNKASFEKGSLRTTCDGIEGKKILSLN